MLEKLKEYWAVFRKEFKLTDIYSGGSKKDPGAFQRYTNGIWKFLLIGIVAIYLILLLVSFDNLPTFDELENPKYNEASLVYSEDGSLMGKYWNENREFVPYDNLNPNLVKALIATEDKFFYKHSGIDFRAISRVIFKTILFSKAESGGGSTITQQLAKLLFDRPNLRNKGKIARTLLIVRVKLKEWLTALKLERSYTKEEIISMYLNKVDFIYGANGVQSAAKTYFGKDQKELGVEECAVIVGMLKNPTLYNPKRFLQKAIDRRNTVLSLMREEGHITKSQYQELSKKTIDISKFNRENNQEGIAPFFRMELDKWCKKLFSEARYKKPDGTEYNIYEDGLKIYTTLDMQYQHHAEAAAKEHMAKIQKAYFNTWTTADPWTFEAEEPVIKIRKEALNNIIRESERYQRIWDKYFGKIINALDKEIGPVEISDKSVQRMMQEAAEPGYLKAELKKKMLTETQVTLYRKIMASNQWKVIKQIWDDFQAEVKKQFQTKIKMNIYDYTTYGLKEVNMSPLDSIRYMRQHLQIGSISVDPKTGFVKSWIGGVNFKDFKFDHVNSRRQVGSTFKPFVYATAIAMQNISPCTEFPDIAYSIPANDPNFKLPETWSPGNAKETFTGAPVNLYRALQYSINSITVKLVIEMRSVEPIRTLCNNLGIEVDAKRKDGGLLIPKFPSIALGSADLSVMEMTGAYTTFANNGTFTRPIFVTRIEDKNGRVIYKYTPEQIAALNPKYNYVMVDMLKKTGTFGTKVECGGKTGTTNNFVDGWFIGITPNLVTGTWVGGEDPWIRFLTLEQGSGSAMARPFFTKFMNLIENDPNIGFDVNAKFIKPPGELGIELDCHLYKQKVQSQNSQENFLPQGGSTEDEIFEEEAPSMNEEEGGGG